MVCRDCGLKMEPHCPSHTCNWHRCRGCRVLFDASRIAWWRDEEHTWKKAG